MSIVPLAEEKKRESFFSSGTGAVEATVIPSGECRRCEEFLSPEWILVEGSGECSGRATVLLQVCIWPEFWVN